MYPCASQHNPGETWAFLSVLQPESLPIFLIDVQGKRYTVSSRK